MGCEAIVFALGSQVAVKVGTAEGILVRHFHTPEPHRRRKPTHLHTSIFINFLYIMDYGAISFDHALLGPSDLPNYLTIFAAPPSQDPSLVAAWEILDIAWGRRDGDGDGALASDDSGGEGGPPPPVHPLAIEDGEVNDPYDPEGDSESVATTQPEQSVDDVTFRLCLTRAMMWMWM